MTHWATDSIMSDRGAGLTWQQIADRLGESVSTVFYRHHAEMARHASLTAKRRSFWPQPKPLSHAEGTGRWVSMAVGRVWVAAR